ncbi:MAG: LytTR family DNA-binding domain-containing protein, partial [Saprospiraceae bacterium]|nr:LytTR family DNA-binding domain-containing protein [Saprospiraceae bacterium]
IKCIAIDDEPFALEVIRVHAEKVPFLQLQATFRNAIQALDYLQKNPIDAIFLDIQMPDINGINFLQSLVTKPMVIFTTAYSDYAVESYNFSAVDYLLKPIEFSRFLTAVNKVHELFDLKNKSFSEQITQSTEKQDFIFIKSGSIQHKIALSDILFLQSEGNYVNFHLHNNKKILARMTIVDALAQLPKQSFMRVHKSYIVAFERIEWVDRHQLKIGQHLIPISKVFGNDFLKKLI